MNIELKIILSITRHLPKMRGSGWFANWLKDIYNRKQREREIVVFNEIIMEVEPKECVDGGILFYPHLYDWQELEFIRKNLVKGGCFVDLGANVGWYSLYASKVVGNKGTVVAIEMDDYNAKKLNHNILSTGARNIQVIKVGLSDKNEKLTMRENTSGNRGGNSLVNGGEEGRGVIFKPLLDVLEESRCKRIDGMKIDIEGMEYRVLSTFFDRAPQNLLPRFVIAEVNCEYDNQGASNLNSLFERQGYKLACQSGLNSIYTLKGFYEK